MEKKAFTLVELIVVITILAILWTIAFISLSWYSAEARDSKRISDTRNILWKINIKNISWILLEDLVLLEDNNNVIINNSWTFSKIWRINPQAIVENDENFRDPSNNRSYPIAYAYWGFWNDKYNFVQIATVSEKQNAALILWNYYKINPETDSPSLFVNDYNEWVVDWGSNLPYELNDKCAPPQWWNWIINNITTYIPECEWKVAWEVITIVWSRYNDNQWTNCDKDDIAICNWISGSWQILAACDVGAPAAWKSWKRFQWWNNYWFKNSWYIKTTTEHVDTSSYWPWCNYYSSTFIKDNNAEWNWSTVTNNNLWWWKWSVIDRQWPCGNWYHLPTYDEILWITYYLTDRHLSSVGLPLAWWTWAKLKKAMYAPDEGSFIGYNWATDQSYRPDANKDVHNRYWMSHWPDEDYYEWNYIWFSARALYLADTYMSYWDFHHRWYWFSVRCFKN